MKLLLGTALLLLQNSQSHLIRKEREFNDNDEPFEMNGVSYRDKEEFIHSSSHCRTRSVDDEEKQDVEAHLERFRAKQKLLGKEDILDPSYCSFEIDVYFHIITSVGGDGDVTDEMVQGQIDVLNHAFSGGSSTICGLNEKKQGIRTPFHFNLKETNRVKNDEWYNMVSMSEAEYAMKYALRKGDASALNFYTVKPEDGLLGWATWPFEYSAYPMLDGVVLWWKTLPNSPVDSAPYNEGDTAVHEIGHWFGLFHTFEGGCSADDSISDTAVEGEPASGCPVDRDSCPGHVGTDPVHNFMDYSDDCCMHTFSAGQVDRMSLMWQAYRISSSVSCEDFPKDWHDSDGPFYKCAYYQEHELCGSMGNDYENNGYTASQACCFCGGGKISDEASNFQGGELRDKS